MCFDEYKRLTNIIVYQLCKIDKKQEIENQINDFMSNVKRIFELMD